MNIRVDRKWLVAGGLAVVALLAAVALLATRGDGSSPERAVAKEEVKHDAAGPGLQRCVDLWNRPSNSSIRQQLSVLLPDYVSVTLSSLYEDRCLVTGANAQLDLAAQFLEGGVTSGATYSAAENGSASTLPVSVTQWNASADEEGYLRLGS